MSIGGLIESPSREVGATPIPPKACSAGSDSSLVVRLYEKYWVEQEKNGLIDLICLLNS